ncbi:MAG: RNA polymerase-associated protein RapA [Gammaproteobacteria bacterium]|nr:RNA polymerase-associated protein RapA [Gammaproteobacteria bacterium]MDP2141001.1 RNA polymerase-associated protein RapA [Gammaproteobacteria bacterium]MDP2349255.1 RNA polymerase-associated protein RapA [Gammaproteobacteria bacterium]
MKSHQFAPGQRWLSETEPELGLGIVAEHDHRTVTIEFRSCDQIRRYSRHEAPLNRIIFAAGDVITTCTGEDLIVIDTSVVHDTVVYHAHRADNVADTISLPESLLSDTLVLNKPIERLFSGQTDASQWFYLRKHTLERLAEIEKSRVLGLCSGRTDLIPHQLYIASEVASRYAPRVMLADEVGLGKTIEAGLILQQQLVSGLASRVLVIVPEPLLHQWLVEMLRRFSLQFSIYDEERCSEILEAMADDENGDTLRNPFMEEQLVLTSIDLFHRQPQWYEFAINGEWDLCIVDEAHHLRDDAPAIGKPGKTLNDYARIKEIALSSKGILLLTATPEQMGQENHFALLQLLDPNRFRDYASYKEEHDHYQELAATINALVSEEALSTAQVQQLESDLSKHHSTEAIKKLLKPLLPGVSLSKESTAEAREKLIRILLDQHGTGRILFRNTRKSLTGFPSRAVNVVKLTLPQQYANVLQEHPDTLIAHLQPESAFISAIADQDDDGSTITLPWTSFDTRVKWLVNFLQGKRGEKVLLICAQDVTAISLEKYLRVNAGIRSSVFHRHMDLIDRDRAAAYFAGTESSAQILVCSEIGSEGRNFQFCRHLVLFDLPLNPDLLEQRIGRLDRIGQKHTIQIHLPVFANSAQEVLFHWYQDALNAFLQVAPAAYRLYRQFSDELHVHLLIGNVEEPAFVEFVSKANALNKELNAELEQGRDRLLEINSFNKDSAARTVQQIREFEAACTPEAYMKEVFDSFGIHYEHNSDDSYAIQPTEEMIVSSFPALPDEGMDATFDRQLSLHREDIQFLTWQHPMVRGAIDLVLDSPQGGAAVSLFSRDCGDPEVASNELIVEAIYRTVAPAPKHLQMSRFLPATHFHYALVPETDDRSGNKVSVKRIRSKLRYIDKHEAATLVSDNQSRIVQLLQQAEKLAQTEMSHLVNMAASSMLQIQTGEIKRLVALKQVNPNVRESELEYLKEQTMQLHQCLKQASVELVAVHIMFRAN